VGRNAPHLPYELCISLHSGNATAKHLRAFSFNQHRFRLDALSGGTMFNRTELVRFEAWSEETRSSIDSYLLGVIESAETELAGRPYRRRLGRERHDDTDGG